jgi:tRNA(Leu) C34 or U34 (ribose-2'-O)-methylase TrmL
MGDVAFDAFRVAIGSRRLVLFITTSAQSAYNFGFMADEVLFFGKESAGVPGAIQLCVCRVSRFRCQRLEVSTHILVGQK